MLTFALIALPLGFLALVATLVLRRQYAPAVISVILSFAALWSGSTQVRHSHSSTAGIAYLFLPSAAAIVGALGAGLVVARGAQSTATRIAGLLCGVAAIGLIAWIALA